MGTKASRPSDRGEVEPRGPGTIDVRTSLGIVTAADREESDPVIAATVLWSSPDTPAPVVVGQLVAPIHPRDSWRDIEDRGQELALHASRAAERDLARGAVSVPDDAGPGVALPTVRPLTRMERRRWVVRQLLRRVARQLSVRLAVKRAALLVALVLFRPIRDRVRTRRRRHPVRVFTFHRVTDLCRDSLTASRRTFEAQLRYIRSTHQVVPLEQALGLLSEASPLERPVAAITFDDAYRSVYDFAAPVMAQQRLPGCCFAPTGFVGSDDRFPWDRADPIVLHLGVMGWDELRQLMERGWTIGGHTSTHARLAECDDRSLDRELQEPLEQLRRRLGIERPPMAYPFGGPDDIGQAGLARVEALGYSACLANHGGENFPPVWPFRIRRIDIGGDHDALTWKGRVHGIDTARWFRRVGPIGATPSPPPPRPGRPPGA